MAGGEGQGAARAGRSFEENPILNSPYEEPGRHWPLDEQNRPVGDGPKDERRPSKDFAAVPPSDQGGEQPEFGYLKENDLVNEIRQAMAKWRLLPPSERGLTSTTVRLLNFWGSREARPRLFFCQREAAETLIWLNEVAPTTEVGKALVERIRRSSDLFRLACKMATGSGKTTVMAMLIAYHAINAGRNRNDPRFARNFLLMTPGLTVLDRLQVLLPEAKENYYQSEKRNLVPKKWLRYLYDAEIVIANAQKFKQRARTEALTDAQQAMIRGHSERKPRAMENNLQMLERIWKKGELPDGNFLVLNDEAHHCYRHKDDEPVASSDEDEDKEEVERNSIEARLWISGIEALRNEVKERLLAVYDLSATPSYLRGSGYEEGVLFPWVVSDFSLLDAIEAGIVKIPRVPVRDGTKAEVPIYRDIYKHIKHLLPKKGRGKAGMKDPTRLPGLLQRATAALYGQYSDAAKAWRDADIKVPPAFIFVCNNTSTSDLVFRYLAGWLDAKSGEWHSGSERTPDFHNADGSGELHDGPRTILVDSYQLGAGKKDLSKELLGQMGCLRKWRENHGDARLEAMTDKELLREAMNTVGKEGRIGEQIRCVVSVSMLTEGWDAQNVTNILGVRAFGTQLLCEQVVGRALRRQDYEKFERDEDGRELLEPEYADIFGVPFNFAQGTPIIPVGKVSSERVRALRERGGESGMLVRFPRVDTYNLKIPDERLRVDFDAIKGDFTYPITPEDDPRKTKMGDITGGVSYIDSPVPDRSDQEIAYELAAYVAKVFFTPPGESAPLHLLNDLLFITTRWVQDFVICKRGARKSLIVEDEHKVRAAERIKELCGTPYKGDKNILYPMLNEYNEEGSSNHVDFFTRKRRLFRTTKSHVNIAVCDSDWEYDFCELLEAEPSVLHYVHNDVHERGLNFQIPYTYFWEQYSYYPDYIVVVDDGKGREDPLKVVAEVKGIRGRRAGVKADTARHLWVPAVNNDGRWGRWAFVEAMDPQDFKKQVATLVQLGKGGNHAT